MSEPRWEEEAALRAMDLLGDKAPLDRAAASDPEVARTIRDFSDIAARLAYDVPQVDPPADLKLQIMQRLDDQAPSAKVIPFPVRWIPWAIAAGLVALTIFQAASIGSLKSRLVRDQAAFAELRQNDSMLRLQLAQLKAMNTGYINAEVMVAWDPRMHRGVVTMRNLPTPPAGHDYQLWVLDPSVPQPISGGLLTRNALSQDFAARPLGQQKPGFAISLEPAGGRASPTPGAILFAVSPGP